ncbi:MAG TPA: hypothetical protein VE860_15495 [Chthoniobacterales bacterium]|jgi:hypothetical protein|nr:hypothetical protein [Chthoniobacterales bacterium]
MSFHDYRVSGFLGGRRISVVVKGCLTHDDAFYAARCQLVESFGDFDCAKLTLQVSEQLPKKGIQI